MCDNSVGTFNQTFAFAVIVTALEASQCKTDLFPSIGLTSLRQSDSGRRLIGCKKIHQCFNETGNGVAFLHDIDP
jgi:hypothetical protein